MTGLTLECRAERLARLLLAHHHPGRQALTERTERAPCWKAADLSAGSPKWTKPIRVALPLRLVVFWEPDPAAIRAALETAIGVWTTYE